MPTSAAASQNRSGTANGGLSAPAPHRAAETPSVTTVATVNCQVVRESASDSSPRHLATMV
ncbi:MAG TPA: hypothetical protein VIJ82_08615 [Streptosporangiaceae bacterium]